VPATDRIMFLRSYLTQLQRATSQGVRVRGYFHWSLMDNFEWADGFSTRFGLLYVDLGHSVTGRASRAGCLLSVIRNSALARIMASVALPSSGSCVTVQLDQHRRV
jgi:beta-glucosidase